MKKLLIALALLSLVACGGAGTAPTETTTTTLPDAVTTTTLAPTTTTLPPVVDQEPSSHEPALAISNQGLKLGGGYLVSRSATIWSFRTEIGFDHNAPVCTTNPSLGSSCSMGQACKGNNGIFFCDGGKTQYKIFGWIYEDFGNTQKPLAEVVVDKFWFAGCLAGMCQGLHETKTDKWGYFEMFSSDTLDTLRIVGRPGYHGFCQNGKPIAGGGGNIQFIGNSQGPSDKKQFSAAFKQYADSDCKPINGLTAKSSQAMPDGVPYKKSAGLWCVMKAGKEVCK